MTNEISQYGPKCERCGSIAAAVYYRDQVDFKGLTLDIDGLAKTVCRECGHVWVSGGQNIDNVRLMRTEYAVRKDVLRGELGLLSGEEISLALRLLDLNKAQAAELFGGGPNAFGKYLTGEVLQSYAMDRLIRLSVAGGQRAIDVLRDGAARRLELSSLFKSGMTTIVIDAPVLQERTVVGGAMLQVTNSNLVVI